MKPVSRDRVNQEGTIERYKPLRGLSGVPADRGYIKARVSKPRRNAARPAPIKFAKDPLELRAIGSPISEGTVLERIVAKRLSVIWGRLDIAFAFLVPVGMGYNPVDFMIYKRPSGRELALEVQGAIWHGPSSRYANVARALDIISTGRDYEEVWEWEIRMGDEFLDTRLLELIGGVSRVSLGGDGELREIRDYEAELQAGVVNPG